MVYTYIEYKNKRTIKIHVIAIHLQAISIHELSELNEGKKLFNLTLSEILFTLSLVVTVDSSSSGELLPDCSFKNRIYQIEPFLLSL